MSTLEIHAAPAPKALARVRRRLRARRRHLLAVIDVFIEAKRQAHEAERRYPFTAW